MDAFASRHLRDCAVFWGWSQVSLKALRHVRELGSAKTFLEHPTSHVDTYVQLTTEERLRWTPSLAATYSHVPTWLIGRMRAEYQSADRIVVLSTFAFDSFVKAGVAASKLVTLPLGVDSDLFTPGPRASGVAKRVLFVGRLELRKGVQYLCEALASLGRRDVELWLVGPLLPEGRLVLARHSTLTTRMFPPLPRRELPSLYQQADVVVLPSVEDAFGLVLLESMACGVPVIATSNTGGPDVITVGEDGWVVPPRNSSALAESLEEALLDGGRLRQMGEAARAKMLARFTQAHYDGRVLLALQQTGVV